VVIGAPSAKTTLRRRLRRWAPPLAAGLRIPGACVRLGPLDGDPTAWVSLDPGACGSTRIATLASRRHRLIVIQRIRPSPAGQTRLTLVVLLKNPHVSFDLQVGPPAIEFSLQIGPGFFVLAQKV
jgi:hypothetical protein